jgi:hypothetical protein
MTKIYAGVGSRETPEPILKMMFKIGVFLAKNNYILRSGAADGADTAFELGCVSVGGEKEIFLPWKGFNKHSDTGLYPNPAHFVKAQSIISHWDKLTQGAKKLHARNVGQILGEHLDSPADFVICWTPDACETKEEYGFKTGGTGTAIKLACEYNIPVINLAKEVDNKERILKAMKR